MTFSGVHSGQKVRIGLVILLASSVVVLFLLNIASEKMVSRRAAERPTDQTILKNLDEVVVKTLTQFGVEEKSIRTRNVQTPNNNFSRVERKALVAGDFSILRFNQSLGELVSQYKASVIGTEKTKERETTIHIVWNGRVVQSIVLISR